MIGATLTGWKHAASASSTPRSSASGATTSAAGSTRPRPSASSTPRSTPASRCSTPPTSTAARGARSSSAGRSGPRRDEAIVATKFGGPIDDERKGGASAAYIARAVEDSLRRLGTDRIDLYQLHFPDAATPFEETLEALDALVRAGKVLEIGGSNFSAEQIDETTRSAPTAAWRVS